ncbi:MAG TPA: bifunctional lysylphosphatidylglycerol flippase/synthetase MprF [Phycisphaerae bacterium]|nr:bifunctional lysylphosphatidylglycerol flippase/synthetase MprF [Phycisphaerae bacterium]
MSDSNPGHPTAPAVPATQPISGWKGWAPRIAGPLFALLMFALALSALHHLLREHHLRDVLAAAGQIPARQLGWAMLLTALCYLTLTGYDAVALLYIRRPLAYPKIAVASFVSYAFSMNLGFAPVTGSAVRYRVYSGWGLTAVDVAKIVVFCGIAFWLGFIALAGVSFLVVPAALPSVLAVPLASTHVVGAVFLVLVAGLLVWGAWMRRPIRIRQWEWAAPSTGISLLGIAVSCTDWALAAGVLYVLLPTDVPHGYPGFLTLFLLAQLVGVISTVPGGLGVFESAMVLLLHEQVPTPPLVGALLVFRAVYYLAPFGVAVLALGAAEAYRHRIVVRRVSAQVGDWIAPVVPHVFAATTFVAGVILLFSGATPALAPRLHLIRDLLPLPVVELSHFVGSVAGAMLLILARGIQRRLNAAYVLTAVLLGVGIVASLLKGADYEEAIALAIMLAALLPSRSEFYRRASLLSPRFSAGWIILIVLAVGTTMWLGFLSFKHVDYRNELWWRFSYAGDAPRFLRATVGAAVVVLVFAVQRLIGPARARPQVPLPSDIEQAAAIVAQQPETWGYFALLGDKVLLFNDERTAFIMYGVQGRSWIALGDPVGPTVEHRELVWRFHELCDQYAGRTVLHNVAAGSLPLYIEVGLTPMKIGESARVPLATFALEGHSRKQFRQVRSKFEREGCTFAIIPREQVPALLPALRRVSGAWLRDKNTREKKFTIGFFDEDYLSRFPMALVRRGEEILAFANVWGTQRRDELSIDLMRYVPDTPHGVIDFLFSQLMLWGRQEGYQWFDLGMAPLSGLESHPLAPVWNRIGNLIFRHGEYFFNYQGLREYKDKFEPVWEPRYLVYPGGLILPHILLDLAALVSGGLSGVVAK